MHYFTSMRIQVKNDKTIHLIIYCFNYNLLDKNTTFEMGLGKQPELSLNTGLIRIIDFEPIP